MNLPAEIFGEVVVVHTPEELGTEQADQFQACVAAMDRRNVVLDLDSTETLDSRGLTALCDLQDRLRGDDGDLKIAVTNTANRKILEMTRLDQQLEVFESVVDAVRSFR